MVFEHIKLESSRVSRIIGIALSQYDVSHFQVFEHESTRDGTKIGFHWLAPSFVLAVHA